MIFIFTENSTETTRPCDVPTMIATRGGIYGWFGVGKKEVDHLEEPPMKNEQQEFWDPKVPFPSINYEPICLFAGYEIHDAPRQVTYLTVDPEGVLAATADTLGRVSLIDLSTKQIIRMWKGYRDTTCHWLQVPQDTSEKPWQKSKTLYLVIHCRQRKVVEVWRVRHGPKVKSIQVSREAQVLSCREFTQVGYVSVCYLSRSNEPFSNMNVVEKIVVTEEADHHPVESPRNLPTKRSDASKLSQDAAVRLNRLQQLLGDTNVVCQSLDVYKALTNIKSIKDLATALDLLAVAPALEEKMDVQGSMFQRLAVSHCTERLNETVQDAGDEAMTNPHVQLLAFKISYYSQVRRIFVASLSLFFCYTYTQSFCFLSTFQDKRGIRCVK